MPINILFENSEDEWDLNHWKESVELRKPGGNASYSLRQTEDVIMIEVPFRQLRSCIRQLFGWSYADERTPWRLRREEIPIQHPRFPWLWADAASSTPMFPKGNPDFPIENGYLAKRDGYSQYNAPEYEANYGIAQIAVRFKPFAGRIYSDDDGAWTPGYEYRRFVGSTSVQPKLEQITAQGGGNESSFYWADYDKTSKKPRIGGPNNTGQHFDGGVFIRKPTTDFTITWYNVEESYLVDTSKNDYWVMPYPSRLLKYLGTINSAEIFGHRPQTLLFDGFRLTRYQQPVLTDSEWGLWAADIEMRFQHFDPNYPDRSSGITTFPPAQTPKNGHLLFPDRQSTGWYSATRSKDEAKRGTYNGDFALRELDFTGIFKHVMDPS